MTATIAPRKTMSITQAAAVAGVSRRTIYNWMKAGRLDTKRLVSGTTRIYEDSLWAKEKDEK